MKRWLILLTVGCLAFAGVANAAVQQGDTELDFSAGFLSLNGNDSPGSTDTDDLFASLGLGYFLTDNVQVGVAGSASWAEVEDTDINSYGLGVFAKYHFMPTNQWVPYVGAQIEWLDTEVDAPGSANDTHPDLTMWGPLVGLRYELNAYNDFYVQYEYQIFEGDSTYDDGHLLAVGIIHQFK